MSECHPQITCTHVQHREKIMTLTIFRREIIILFLHNKLNFLLLFIKTKLREKEQHRQEERNASKKKNIFSSCGNVTK